MTNLKQALEGILNNPEHASKLTENFEYLKNIRKSSNNRDGTNFVNKNALRAKDTSIKHIKSINSELEKQN